MPATKTIPILHEKYIKGTPRGAIVQNVRTLICSLTSTVIKNTGSTAQKVYISTKVLKHNYDKRPAVEYDFLIEILYKIIKYPKEVYANKQGKRGNFCFIRIERNERYLCVLELIEKNQLEVVTFYRVPKEKYLDTFKLLWSRRDDSIPHRSAFDVGNRPTNTPQ